MIFQELPRKASFEGIWSILEKTYYRNLPEWRAKELDVHGAAQDEWLEDMREPYGTCKFWCYYLSSCLSGIRAC